MNVRFFNYGKHFEEQAATEGGLTFQVDTKATLAPNGPWGMEQGCQTHPVNSAPAPADICAVSTWRLSRGFEMAAGGGPIVHECDVQEGPNGAK